MLPVLLAIAVASFVSCVQSAGIPLTVTEEAWFEVEVKNFEGKDHHYRGRFTVALFGDIAPLTVLNFISLVKGYKRQKVSIHQIPNVNVYETLTYRNTPIHRIVPDFLIQMGDIVKGDGTSGTSIYGPKFNDEEFILSHKTPGIVSMANYGPDTNASQFFILLTKARWLDKKHVAFGKVIHGFDVVEKLGNVPVKPDSAIPELKVMIVNCGLNNIDRKYEMTQQQLASTEDL
jgi:peptidyl-prolyl cis-trans isomerase B (cyclophilin B)